MPKYQLSYQILSDFYVVVEAEDADAAKDMLMDEGLPTTEVGGNEVDWVMSDIFYDTIDVSEVEE